MNPSSTDSQSSQDFAQMLKRLEEIVKELEGGELSLEQSLAKFEQGVKLAKRLESVLSEAESKVEEVLKLKTKTENDQIAGLEEIHEV